MQEKSPCLKVMPKVCGSGKYTIFLSPAQLELIGATPAPSTMAIVFGATQVQARLVVITQPSSLVQMSPEVMAALHLFPGINLQLIESSTDLIRFGPIIAVMVSDSAWKHIREGKGVPEITVPAQWCREKGVFSYFFTIHEILWQHKLIKGTFYNPVKEEWDSAWLPFPDVVYDQATFHKNPEFLNRAKLILAKFKNLEEIQLINHRRYFGKWEIAQCLSFFKDTRHYIPDSLQLNNKSELDYMLKKWKAIFIKGEYGSYGQQVAWVCPKEKTPQESSLTCQFGGPQGECKEFSNTTDLYEAVKNRFGATTLMAQQAIDLAEIFGRKFDLRVIVQKNSTGHWQMNLVAMRMAPSGSFVTNISSGGDELVIEKRDFPYYFKYLTWDKLEKASLECVTALESHYGMHGEIGLDFGVEDKGRLWLFEANSKPSTMDYLRLANKETAYQLYMQPFEYGSYLVRRMARCLPSQVRSSANPSLPVIKLSQALCQKIGVTNYQRITIGVGSFQRPVIVVHGCDVQDSLSLCEFLELPEYVNWEYDFKENILNLGPIKAIKLGQDLFLNPIQLSHPNKEASKVGLVYAYCPEDIDYANCRAAGYQLTLGDDGPKCTAGLFPLHFGEDF